MRENDKIIEIEIPQERQVEYVNELADFIENELKPPSRLRWILIFFLLGVSGGVGLGIALWWIK
jgi:hypothetical protein